MMELIREWVLGLMGAALLTGAALALTPAGRVREVLRVLCGVIMALSLLGPAAGFDWGAYAENLGEYRARAEALGEQADEAARDMSRTIIERQLAAYILDKAQVLGVSVFSAGVTAKWGDEGIWYPYEARIKARGESEELKRAIEAELGIPEARQYWSAYGE